MQYIFCPLCNLEIPLYGSILLQKTPKITANNFLYVRLKKKSHFKEESKARYAITVFQHSCGRKRKVLLKETEVTEIRTPAGLYYVKEKQNGNLQYFPLRS